MRILILAGGESEEREVSAASGLTVAKAFASAGCEIALIDPSRQASKTVFTLDFDVAERQFFAQRKKPFTPPFDIGHITVMKTADKVFSALHGGIGENGRLASMLEIFGIPYSGSSPESLAIAMNKADTKIYYEHASILTPSYTLYKKGAKKTPTPPSYPCVVKPSDGGSSIGVSIVYGKKELDLAVERASAVSDTVIIEQRILGRELSVCVLEDKAFSVTEIIPKGSFYDYECKYLHGGAREITPAPLPREITERALKIAARAHASLGLTNFSRTDLILQKDTLRLYALETNALPGMTETSILPNAARSVGIGMSELVMKMLGQ